MSSIPTRRIAFVLLVLAAIATVFFVTRPGRPSEGEKEVAHQLHADSYVRMRDSVMDKAKADSLERRRRALLAKGVVVTSDGRYCTTSGACMGE